FVCVSVVRTKIEAESPQIRARRRLERSNLVRYHDARLATTSQAGLHPGARCPGELIHLRRVSGALRKEGWSAKGQAGSALAFWCIRCLIAPAQPGFWDKALRGRK